MPDVVDVLAAFVGLVGALGGDVWLRKGRLNKFVILLLKKELVGWDVCVVDVDSAAIVGI